MILVVCGGGRSVEILRERREEMRKGGRVEREEGG
jgi:hypothetical protein